jgi:hypothetical protein
LRPCLPSDLFACALQFNIKNDFTAEEEAQILEENKWCEEI